ncbi:MAG: hypothetical protein IJY38_00320 [Clostridia bacterium]|nr:hypothetical protein [Clostridia bacterium]
MMTENYEFLGLSPEATDEEITQRYEELKAKYKEERWQYGEAGNEAAKNLTKLETVYAEIVADRKEQKRSTDGVNAYEEVAALLKADKIAEAQEKLDEFNERNAEWHYLQAVVFYKKNWTNESKKQLEIAMQMDGENKKYRDAYGKLNARADYENQSPKKETQEELEPQGMPDEQQMGGNGCSTCLNCCYTYLCVDCLFSLCCGFRQ